MGVGGGGACVTVRSLSVPVFWGVLKPGPDPPGLCSGESVSQTPRQPRVSTETPRRHGGRRLKPSPEASFHVQPQTGSCQMSTGSSAGGSLKALRDAGRILKVEGSARFRPVTPVPALAPAWSGMTRVFHPPTVSRRTSPALISPSPRCELSLPRRYRPTVKTSDGPGKLAAAPFRCDRTVKLCLTE